MTLTGKLTNSDSEEEKSAQQLAGASRSSSRPSSAAPPSTFAANSPTQVLFTVENEGLAAAATTDGLYAGGGPSAGGISLPLDQTLIGRPLNHRWEMWEELEQIKGREGDKGAGDSGALGRNGWSSVPMSRQTVVSHFIADAIKKTASTPMLGDRRNGKVRVRLLLLLLLLVVEVVVVVMIVLVVVRTARTFDGGQPGSCR